MKKLTFLVALVVLLSACAPSADAVQTAIAETQAAVSTATASATPSPTNTLTPTITLAPTPTALTSKNLLLTFKKVFQQINDKNGVDFSAIDLVYDVADKNNPSSVTLSVQDNGYEFNKDICEWGLLATMVILRDNPSSIFPGTIKTLTINCYNFNSILQLTYKTSWSNITQFTKANDIDYSKVTVIEMPTPIAPPATQTAEHKNFISTQRAAASTATKEAKNTQATKIAQYVKPETRELVTYPDNLKGQLIKVRGRVFNINGNDQFQFWIDGGRDAAYIVMQNPFSDIYEDTWVTVYGVGAGENCGTNAFGAEICQPLILGDFYELK
jgi:hypothetical protein